MKISRIYLRTKKLLVDLTDLWEEICRLQRCKDERGLDKSELKELDDARLRFQDLLTALCELNYVFWFSEN